MNIFTTLLVQPLFNILFIFYALIPGHDFGVAVILLTVLVRILLWPLVTKQLHSQRVMQQLQPELARVKKEAAGDRQKETQMLMELYKEKGTSPFASLMPLLIQLPIFFALYIVLRDAVQPNQISQLAYGFVQQLQPVADIINHKVTFSATLFGLVDLTKPNVALAAFAALAQFYQAKQLQPKNQTGETDQARIMRAMIYFFPVITFVFGLTLPSALALYWGVTSLVAAFQQYWVLLRDAEELEEGVVIRESTATGGTKSLPSGKKKTARKGKKGKRKAKN